MINAEKAREIVEKQTTLEGLKKYKYIMDTLRKTDVSADKEFQKVFGDFYQLRRFYSEEFREQYFIILEEMKDLEDVSFNRAFERLKSIENSNEMSFSSKMVHTINPKYPIWDKIVTEDHFGLKKPYAGKQAVKAFCKRYDEYMQLFYEYMNSEEGISLIKVFDEKFPNAAISNVKKLDFIIWQDRTKKEKS